MNQQYPPQGAYPPQAYPGAQPGAYPPHQGIYPSQQMGGPVYGQPAQMVAAPVVQPPAVVVAPAIQPAVIMGNPTIIYGNYTTHCTCLHCGYSGYTLVSRTPGAMLWISVLILFIVFPFVCCIPCCIPDCYDATHYCSNCKRVVGTKQAGFQ